MGVCGSHQIDISEWDLQFSPHSNEFSLLKKKHDHPQTSRRDKVKYCIIVKCVKNAIEQNDFIKLRTNDFCSVSVFYGEYQHYYGCLLLIYTDKVVQSTTFFYILMQQIMKNAVSGGANSTKVVPLENGLKDVKIDLDAAAAASARPIARLRKKKDDVMGEISRANTNTLFLTQEHLFSVLQQNFSKSDVFIPPQATATITTPFVNDYDNQVNQLLDSLLFMRPNNPPAQTTYTSQFVVHEALASQSDQASHGISITLAEKMKPD